MTDFISKKEDLPNELSTEKINEIAEKIVVLHNKNEGSTVNIEGENLAGKSFYAVAYFPRRSKRFEGRDLTKNIIVAFIKRNASLLKYPCCAVGTWYDKGDDETWIDISLLVENEEEAVKLAFESNQISIFNLQEAQEIEIGGSGLPNLQDSFSDEAKILAFIKKSKEKK